MKKIITGNTQLYSGEDLLNFHYLQVIVSQIFSIIASEKEAFIEDRRTNLIKPNICRLIRGFMLEVRKASDAPESICTPWGKWECFGGSTGLTKRVLSKIKAEFGIHEPYLPGDSHIYYVIKTIKDPRKKNEVIILPGLSVWPEETCNDYDECMNKWKQMMTIYKPYRPRKKKT
jgi:hypothetical protein